MENTSNSRVMKIIRRILLAIIILAVVATPCFVYFNLNTNSRLALRKAKNVKIALCMTDIEYRGINSCIYNPNKLDGLEDGVQERVEKTLDESCNLFLKAYDKKTGEIKCFEYKTGRYTVDYELDDDGNDTWKVYYNIKTMDY